MSRVMALNWHKFWVGHERARWGMQSHPVSPLCIYFDCLNAKCLHSVIKWKTTMLIWQTYYVTLNLQRIVIRTQILRFPSAAKEEKKKAVNSDSPATWKIPLLKVESTSNLPSDPNELETRCSSKFHSFSWTLINNGINWRRLWFCCLLAFRCFLCICSGRGNIALRKWWRWGSWW